MKNHHIAEFHEIIIHNLWLFLFIQYFWSLCFFINLLYIKNQDRIQNIWRQWRQRQPWRHEDSENSDNDDESDDSDDNDDSDTVDSDDYDDSDAVDSDTSYQSIKKKIDI